MISRIEFEAEIRNIIEYLLGHYWLSERAKQNFVARLIELVENKIFDGEKIK